QGSTAARTLAGGTAIAMACDPDRVAVEIVGQQIFEPASRTTGDGQWQIEHLVEVAVIKIAAPTDRHEVAAQDAAKIFFAMGLTQQPQITVEVALGDEGRSKPLNWHVGKRIQPVKQDAEFVS